MWKVVAVNIGVSSARSPGADVTDPLKNIYRSYVEKFDQEYQDGILDGHTNVILLDVVLEAMGPKLHSEVEQWSQQYTPLGLNLEQFREVYANFCMRTGVVHTQCLMKGSLPVLLDLYAMHVETWKTGIPELHQDTKDTGYAQWISLGCRLDYRVDFNYEHGTSMGMQLRVAYSEFLRDFDDACVNHAKRLRQAAKNLSIHCTMINTYGSEDEDSELDDLFPMIDLRVRPPSFDETLDAVLDALACCKL